ncbi:MAG: DNA polymerase II large subunit, partial [Candidatus Bathyarchaeota archaeon]|nr:DNA polymerase II large subunit [Candidatus Bathyarchaeota archaeon]
MTNYSEEYYSILEKKFLEIYNIAKAARSKGNEASKIPESMLAVDLAERVEKSVGPEGIAKRIRELSKIMPREEIAFKIAEEIIYGTFGSKGENAAEQAIRTALAILDEGVTVAPIQGISSVRIKTNLDKTRYLAIYYAGPIRSAGGTDMGLTLIITDFVQKLLGLGRYKATKEEAQRFVEELRLYEREVARFQFRIPDNELFNTIMKLPVEVNGVQTDPVEMTSFRDVFRVETNCLRGGALRVVNDGLVGRTKKVIKIVDKLGIQGWSWLNDIKIQETDVKASQKQMYLEDVIAGRPIFSFPNAKGGFRLRYGRSRNTGLASIGINPVTMKILSNFIASGTQLRIETPGKAGTVLPVDYIEPPVVKLKDGSVIRVDNLEIAKEIENSIESILFIGDLLIGFGEFLENNKPLLPSGFVEEWWSELLRKTLKLKDRLKIESNEKRLTDLISNSHTCIPGAKETISLSKSMEIPLHPRYNLFWNNIDFNELSILREKLLSIKIIWEDGNPLSLSVTGERKIKSIMEKICLPHKFHNGIININEDYTYVLYHCLALKERDKQLIKENSTIETIYKLSGMRIIDKAPTFIGARMGRPEKAKKREMRPSVHSLFPIGLAGGSRRNILEAAKKNKTVYVDLERRRCPTCKTIVFSDICPDCYNETFIEYICPKCGKTFEQEICHNCKSNNKAYDKQSIIITEILDSAQKKLSIESLPDIIKGVKGLTSDTKKPEILEKGILRAKHDLSVFKDGTVRFDTTNTPLTHFRPIEIGLSLEKLYELKYFFDINDQPIENTSQLCELKIQDIVIPEECAKYFVKISNFIDDLLIRLYGLPSFYKAKSKEDMIGQIVVGISPHTSVGVIGRIIGFTKNKICLAHPFWQAAKRRDCDGDEDALCLALDVLLNFSKTFIPKRIGGMMDSPIILTLKINPIEVARQAYNIEIADKL